MSDLLKGVAELQRKVERAFRDLWATLPKVPPSAFLPSEPLVDIEDRDDELVVYMDVPGFSKDEIKVRVTEDSVEVVAEKSGEGVEEGRRYILRQRLYSGFRKRIDLPVKVRPEMARAKLVNGVLEIHLPKSAEAKEIELTVEEVEE